MTRKILHCDADCFYAAIEIRDDPTLIGKAIAIGSLNRGVIATCSYEARRFGIRSAMSSAYALQRCPELILLPPNMEKYRYTAKQLKEIFLAVTPIVESISLDEAYLDVTEVVDNSRTATELAQLIRKQVVQHVGITLSAGVSVNKFVAKVASDWCKPDGLTVVKPKQLDAFVRELPVTKVPGVGQATLAKLTALGISTCGDVRRFSKEQLSHYLGKFGVRLHELSFGIDTRAVVPYRPRKSVSVEKTFDTDLDHDMLGSQVPALVERLEKRLSTLVDSGIDVGTINKQFVKVKFADFSQTTLAKKKLALSWGDFSLMLIEASQRKHLPIRLLGIGIGFQAISTSVSQPIQIELFDS